MTSSAEAAKRLRDDAAAGQLILQAEEVPLAHGLVVGEARDPRDPGHALDLDARPALDADVDVLPGGPDPGPHPPRAPDETPEDLGDVGDLLRRPHVRAGDRLDERHAQPVREVNAAVADVADLAAGVLLEAELDDPDVPSLVGDLPVDADDRRPLEPRRDAPVEVLLAGDVQLVDHLAVVEQADLEGDVQRLLVDHEGRRVVHLVGADGLPFDPVDDLFFGLELHEGRAVVLPELGQGRPHVAEDLGVELRAIAAGRAAAEQLLGRQELLMDLEAGLEPDGRVVPGRHVLEGLEEKIVGDGEFSVPKTKIFYDIKASACQIRRRR